MNHRLETPKGVSGKWAAKNLKKVILQWSLYIQNFHPTHFFQSVAPAHCSSFARYHEYCCHCEQGKVIFLVRNLYVKLWDLMLGDMNVHSVNVLLHFSKVSTHLIAFQSLHQKPSVLTLITRGYNPEIVWLHGDLNVHFYQFGLQMGSTPKGREGIKNWDTALALTGTRVHTLISPQGQRVYDNLFQQRVFKSSLCDGVSISMSSILISPLRD